MVVQVFSIVSTAVGYCLDTFADVMTSSGFLGTFLGVVSAVMILRFIVYPLIGGGTGGTRDSVKKNKGGDEE